METPTLAVTALRSLEFIIGHWKTEGTVRATSTSPAVSIKGTDTYEWTLDGAFILHKVDVDMGKEKTKAFELIGFEVSNTTFSLRSFDTQGGFAFMHGKLDGEKTFKIEAEKMRSTLRASESGDTMTAFWEQSEDGIAWLPWMDMTFTRNPEVVDCQKGPLQHLS